MRNLYIISCLFAAISPLMIVNTSDKMDLSDFPGWQKTFEGKTLTKLPLSEIENSFSKDFPGYISRFSDGKRQVIFRWVKEETRKLHPASDCFKGIGYTIKPLSINSSNNQLWGRFEADKENEKIVVSEIIYDNHGNSWTDVSSWYWSAFISRYEKTFPVLSYISHKNTSAPWWTVTVSENK